MCVCVCVCVTDTAIMVNRQVNKHVYLKDEVLESVAIRASERVNAVC